MKIRWRQHELLLITLLSIAQIFNFIVDAYHASFEDIRQLKELFNKAVLPFNYNINVLLPQIGSVLLLYCGYLVIARVILPMLLQITFDDIEQLVSAKIARVFIWVIALSFLLAVGANILSYFGRPDFVNYAGYGTLSKFGYNDQPLTDIFFGFQRSLGLAVFILALVVIRDLAIARIEREGPQRSYRILLTNNITMIISIYLIIIVFINPLHREFVQSVFIGITALLYYLYTTFWLFPLVGEKRFRSKVVLLRLLPVSFLCSIPFSIFFDETWPVLLFITWLIILFIVTPIFWVLFQMRRDNILEIKGMQEQLAHSTADLQFLRAQINPHFLFNALNTLYGTALLEKSDRTADGIQKLGDMMRFVLHENNKDFISMKKETEYLSNYIELQKLRLQTSSNIQIEDNIEESDCNQTIAPMLLVPLVENAFKHGISHLEKSWIQIRLECGESTIYFEVKNSLHKKREDDVKNETSGIGLINVRERLGLIYPNRHELYIHQNSTEFIARLLIK